MKWTPETIARAASMLAAGDTAKQIGEAFNVSRGSIAGAVFRIPELGAIGFARSTRGMVPVSREERKRRQNVAAKLKRDRLRAERAAKAPEHPVKTPKPPKQVKAKIRVVSNNTALSVSDWIAKNGVRRFEKGESSDYYAVASFLKDRGFSLKLHRAKFFLGGPRGRPRQMRWNDVVTMVDKLRLAEGLQPFKAA